jgi:hypothetical protein
MATEWVRIVLTNRNIYQISEKVGPGGGGSVLDSKTVLTCEKNLKALFRYGASLRRFSPHSSVILTSRNARAFLGWSFFLAYQLLFTVKPKGAEWCSEGKLAWKQCDQAVRKK